MTAREADFAATVPWEGVIGRPVGTDNNQVAVWDATLQKWVPISLAHLKELLDALP